MGLRNEKSFAQNIEDYRRRVIDGEPCDTIVASMHSDGFSIIEAIKAVRLLYGLDLKEAKIIVTDNPAWSGVVRAAEPFHDALEQAVEMLIHDGLISRIPSTEEK